MVTEAKLRVLVDANVLFSSVIWPRWPFEVLQHAVAGDYQLVLSPRIIEEARRAIARTAPFAWERLISLLEASEYEVVATPSEAEIAAHNQLSRDAKDVHVALAAITAKVDCLVSLDKDLTERYAGNQLLHDDVTVVLPAVFLRDYMGWSSQALEAIRSRSWRDLGSNDME